MLAGCSSTPAQGGHSGGGEANLQLPDLGLVSFGGVSGRLLLMLGLLICVGGVAFGAITLLSLRKLPVHASMREISELIYETCKAYLVQQGRFLVMLWLFIGAVIFIYFQFLAGLGIGRTLIVLLFSVIGMAGSYAIAWYGIRVNTYANSRTAFASLKGRPFDVYAIPLRSGMSVGMMLISVELFMML
ncbi:MAG: sodium/proton-translocating pyrophosphatase, partial [Actinomycetia bacterium]|nr:sodium/proton-translocating pyrophosphatase [Actinomycetes bacterium]